MQVGEHEEPGKSSRGVPEAEADRSRTACPINDSITNTGVTKAREQLRSEVSRGPNARAGAREAVATPKVKRELQAEAEHLRLEVLRLKSIINGEVGVADWQVLRKSAVGVVDWQGRTKSSRDDYTLPKQDRHVETMDDCTLSWESSLVTWV